MASKRIRVIDSLPIIGQYHHDREERRIQHEFYAKHYSTLGYVEDDPTVLGWLRSKVPNRQSSFAYGVDLFPVLKWIPNYNLHWFLGDMVAGLTVGAVIVPKSMAYARLAHLPVQYGLCTSFFGTLLYWIFGTSKDIAVGPVAVASIITAEVVRKVQDQHPDQNLSAPAIASAIAILAGSVVALLGLLRLGRIVDLISLPTVAAFISGSAITVMLGQIPSLVGMGHVNARDPAVKIALNVLKHFRDWKLDAAFGVSALLFLYGTKWTCSCVARKSSRFRRHAFFISSLRAVFVVLFFTVVSYAINRTRKEHPSIELIGFVPRGLRSPSSPRIDSKLLPSLIAQVPVVALVMVIEHISIGKEFGRLYNYTINPNSEFIAIGITNILGPFFNAYAATGSLSGTAINAKAGARTPLCGVFTSVVVLIAMYTMTAAFFFVPTAALAAIIIHAIGDLVTPPSTIYHFWKIDPLDVLVFSIGITIILVNSIENGVYTMIALSLLIFLARTFRAHGSFLGRVNLTIVHAQFQDGLSVCESSKDAGFDECGISEDLDCMNRHFFLPLDRRNGCNSDIKIQSPRPGIFIYRLNHGLNYTNCNKQMNEMLEVIVADTRRGARLIFENKGERPWNVTNAQAVNEDHENAKPRLDAVILDFSNVDEIDITSMQCLIDIRHTLERYAAPYAVQWHFACVQNVWSRKALVAAGFGSVTLEPRGGAFKSFKAVYSLADTKQPSCDEQKNGERQSRGASPAMISSDEASTQDNNGAVPDVEQEQKLNLDTLDVENQHTRAETMKTNMRSIYGINRPFFHPDVQGAVTSAVMNSACNSSVS